MQSAVDVSSFLFAPICLLSTWLSTPLAAPLSPIFPPTTPASPLLSSPLPAHYVHRWEKNTQKKRRFCERQFLEMEPYLKSFTPSHRAALVMLSFALLCCDLTFSFLGCCLILSRLCFIDLLNGFLLSGVTKLHAHTFGPSMKTNTLTFERFSSVSSDKLCVWLHFSLIYLPLPFFPTHTSSSSSSSLVSPIFRNSIFSLPPFPPSSPPSNSLNHFLHLSLPLSPHPDSHPVSVTWEPLSLFSRPWASWP